jgi:hypothetical protein
MCLDRVGAWARRMVFTHPIAPSPARDAKQAKMHQIDASPSCSPTFHPRSVSHLDFAKSDAIHYRARCLISPVPVILPVWLLQKEKLPVIADHPA